MGPRNADARIIRRLPQRLAADRRDRASARQRRLMIGHP